MYSDFALLFVIGFLVYLMASLLLVPFVASEENRSFFGWAFLALLFSPLLALIALAALPVKVKREEEASELSEEIPGFKWRKG